MEKYFHLQTPRIAIKRELDVPWFYIQAKKKTSSVKPIAIKRELDVWCIDGGPPIKVN